MAGRGAGENLTLASTSHATKGTVNGNGAGNAVAIGNSSGAVSISSSGFNISSNGIFSREETTSTSHHPT